MARSGSARPGRRRGGATLIAMILMTGHAASPAAGQCPSPLLAKDAPGAAGDRLGASVSIDGRWAVAGAPTMDVPGHPATDTGAVLLYHDDGSAWTRVDTIAPPGLLAGDEFGAAVALLGDVLVVGAPGSDASGQNVGAVHVFRRAAPGAAFVLEATLGPGLSGPLSLQPGDALGRTLDLGPDRILAGAPRQDAQGIDSGAAYLFERVGAAWSRVTRLLASDGSTGDQFGAAVALDQGRALIGAPRHDAPFNDAGAAYAFVFDGAAWTFDAKLSAPVPGAADSFGASVDLSAGRALVGAPLDDDRGADSGAAHVFVRVGSSWSHEAALQPASLRAGDVFGNPVRLEGDTAVVAAALSDEVALDGGCFHVFRLAAGAWTTGAGPTAPGAQPNDSFAAALALSAPDARGARHVVVGASTDDRPGAPDAGSVSFFVDRAIILAQPTNDWEVQGAGNAAFSVDALTAGAATFRWRRAGVDLVDGPSPGGGTISGARSRTLRIASPGPLDAASYDCVVGEPCGTLLVSGSATLTVGPGGNAPAPCPGDASGDGFVDFADIISALSNWSRSCP
ncbi:MAG: hypothetical protein SFZ24_07530 [Planctomycetota bacterium]|nr:hypothetical protein [Planctomycetota bacterium]